MTSHFPILTALSFPAVSLSPSPSCLQWSGDGQTILLAHQGVIILTPELGITVETSSVVRQGPDSTNPTTGIRTVGWMRTIIEVDKATEPYLWAIDCQDWGTVSLGSLDLSLVAVTCSPSNLTKEAGCVLAILDSNMEISLYTAVKSYITGKWQKISRLTNFLDEIVEVDEGAVNMSSLKTLNRQVSCLAWSSQAGFGMAPSPGIDASLLALGTNSGSILLLRYHPEREYGAELIITIKVQDRRVTHLAWTPWSCSVLGETKALLAYAIADGSIHVVEVTQTLTQSNSPQTFSPEFKLNVSYGIMAEACRATRRSTGALCWADVPGSLPILVFHRPGTIHLWRQHDPAVSWSGLRSIPLNTQKASVGSTALSPISGITHIHKQDALVVSLADGSFHIIPGLGTKTVPEDLGSPLTSDARSIVARQHFVTVSEDDIQNLDVNYTHGMTSYDSDAYFVWIHESMRPTNFDYKHDAKHNNLFILAQLCSNCSDEELLGRIETTILNVDKLTGEPSTAILRSLYLQLHNNERLAGIVPRVLELLGRSPPADTSVQSTLQPWTGDLTPEFRRQFRSSLRTHLFGCTSLLSQRLRVALSNFCERTIHDQAQREAFRIATADAVQVLWPRILRVLIRHIHAALKVISPDDAPFVWRVVAHATLPGLPEDLKAEAEALSAEVKRKVPTSEGLTNSLSLEELCPACQARVSLTDMNTAVCPNGHHWQRCSITSFLLSTPMVRTCVGCSRKAFLPSHPDSSATSWRPLATRSWLVEDLLDIVRRCFFCGSNFVILV